MIYARGMNDLAFLSLDCPLAACLLLPPSLEILDEKYSQLNQNYYIQCLVVARARSVDCPRILFNLESLAELTLATLLLARDRSSAHIQDTIKTLEEEKKRDLDIFPHFQSSRANSEQDYF